MYFLVRFLLSARTWLVKDESAQTSVKALIWREHDVMCRACAGSEYLLMWCKNDAQHSVYQSRFSTYCEESLLLT